MLTGFREGVREGTYQGKHLKHIALGIEWLGPMINQWQAQLELAKREQKDAIKKAQEAIRNSGGSINGSHLPN